MTEDKDRPIIPAWGVVDDDQDGKLVHISTQKGECEEIARRTSTFPNRRVVPIWVRQQKQD